MKKDNGAIQIKLYAIITIDGHHTAYTKDNALKCEIDIKILRNLCKKTGKVFRVKYL